MSDYREVWAIPPDGPSRFSLGGRYHSDGTTNRFILRRVSSTPTSDYRTVPMFAHSESYPSRSPEDTPNTEVILTVAEQTDVLDQDTTDVVEAIESGDYTADIDNEPWEWTHVLKALAWAEERAQNRADVLEAITGELTGG